MHDISLRVHPDTPGGADAKSHRVQQIPARALQGMLSSAPGGQQSSFPVPSSHGCDSVAVPAPEPEPTPDADPDALCAAIPPELSVLPLPATEPNDTPLASGVDRSKLVRPPHEPATK